MDENRKVIRQCRNTLSALYIKYAEETDQVKLSEIKREIDKVKAILHKYDPKDKEIEEKVIKKKESARRGWRQKRLAELGDNVPALSDRKNWDERMRIMDQIRETDLSTLKMDTLVSISKALFRDEYHKQKKKG